MDAHDSITYWITRLKLRDPEAAQRVWERYFHRVVELARKRLRGLPPGVDNEEDVALGALFSLVRGAADGRFPRLADRHDLWQVLLMLTERKLDDAQRYELAQKRDRRRVQTARTADTDSSADGTPLEQVADPQPTPQTLTLLSEELQRLLARLPDDQVRAMARLRLEGYQVEEIAAQLGRPRRTVERKLQMIRQTWEKELRR